MSHSLAKTDDSVTLSPTSSKLKPRRISPFVRGFFFCLCAVSTEFSCCHRNDSEPSAHPIISLTPAGHGAVMTEHARECLERAKYCTRLAEAESDSELKAYLLKLAVDWTHAAQEELEGA